MWTRALCVIALAVHATAGSVFRPSLDLRMSWSNPKAEDPTCASGNTVQNGSMVLAAQITEGPVVYQGPVWIQHPITLEWYSLHELLFQTPFRVICLPGPPPAPIAPPPPPPALPPAGILCNGTGPASVDSGCVWRTDWSVWACHPVYPVCVCPFQTTQDPLQPHLVWHRHWVFDNTSSAAAANASVACAPQLSGGSNVALGELVGGSVIPVVVSCQQLDPVSSTTGCSRAIRSVLTGAPSLLDFYPPILGAPWLFAALQVPAAAYYLVADAIVAGPRCQTTVYYSLVPPLTAARQLTGSCSPTTATQFILKPPAPGTVSPADRGIAVAVQTSNGANLPPTTTTVCWDQHQLRLCGASSVAWRWMYTDYNGFALLEASSNTVYLPIPLSFRPVPS